MKKIFRDFIFPIIAVAAATKLFIYPTLNKLEPSFLFLTCISLCFIPLFMLKHTYLSKNKIVRYSLTGTFGICGGINALFAAYSFERHHFVATILFLVVVAFIFLKAYSIQKLEEA